MLGLFNNGAVGNGDVLTFHCRKGMKKHKLFLMTRNKLHFEKPEGKNGLAMQMKK